MATPPPPPPPSGTTIGKYIARFRHESPRPRDARATARQEEFWWLESRRETASASPRTPREKEEEENRSETSQMEWELELLSTTSYMGDGASRRLNASDEKDVLPSVASSVASSWSPRLHSDASEPMPPRRRPSPRDHNTTTVVDDGFVLLPTDALEEKAMLEASLEDPELVIQRVRRRLGFQPPTTLASPPMYAADELLMFSPVPSGGHGEDDHHGFAETSYEFLQQEDSRSLSLRLELSQSLDDAVMGSESPLSPPVSIDLQSSSSAEITRTDDQSPPPADENLEEAASGLNMSEEALPSDGVEIDEEETVDSVVASSESHDKADEKDLSARGVADPALKKDNDEQKSSQMNAGTRSPAKDQPIPLIQEQENNTKLEPVVGNEKRSPRLPPLSPARGPMFRSAPVTPRSLDSNPSDPEIPAETSKTLDSLLSLVVHTWGENSFFGGSDDGESESIGSSPVKEEDTISKQPNQPTSPVEEPKPIDEPNDKEPSAPDNGDSIDPSDFATDPVVAMLCDRIALFESALERLDDKNSPAQTP